MQRIRMSLATVTLATCVTGVIAVSFAEDGKSGPVLPPPSLFDEEPTQVRAVQSARGEPAPVVVKAKPAPVSAAPEAVAPAPVLRDSEVAPPRKVVWWKPWTWFSGGSKPAAVASEPVSAASEPAQQKAVEEVQAAHGVDGYAFDRPSKIIRTGMGTCLKTGMWEAGSPQSASADCGAPVAAQESPAPMKDAAKTAPAAKAERASATADKAATQAYQNPVEVSALAPEREISPKALSVDDGKFESMRMEAGTQPVQEASPKQPVAPQPASIGGKKAAAKNSGQDKADASALTADMPLSMSAEALFGFKSAKLLWGGQQQLDKVATQLKGGDFQTVRVVGHTDRVGTPDRNKKLSLRRAKAVKEYLVLKGVEPDRIVVDGKGAAEPITEPRQCAGLSMTARRACQAPDRRVEIVVMRALAKKKSDDHAGG